MTIMEISHHQPAMILRPAARRLAEAALSGDFNKETQQQANDGVVRMPGITEPGGINSLLASRGSEREFKIVTRMKALDNGWPHNHHFEIERRRRIPVIGTLIANRLHQKMMNGIEQRRVKDLEARF